MFNLLELLKSDQENIKQFVAGSITKEEFAKEQDLIIRKFEEFLDENGFPYKNKFGEDLYKAGIALSLHSSPKLMRRVLALLENATSEQLDLPHKAYLIDKLRVLEGEKQIYGTQFKRLENGSIEFLPIADQETIDEKRKQVGLPTLEDYRNTAQS